MTMSCHEMTQFNFLSMMKNVQNLKPHPPIFPSHLKKTSHQMFLLFLFLLYPLTYSFFYLFLILPSISCYSRKCGGRRKIAIIVKVAKGDKFFPCLLDEVMKYFRYLATKLWYFCLALARY